MERSVPITVTLRTERADVRGALRSELEARLGAGLRRAPSSATWGDRAAALRRPGLAVASPSTEKGMLP